MKFSLPSITSPRRRTAAWSPAKGRHVVHEELVEVVITDREENIGPGRFELRAQELAALHHVLCVGGPLEARLADEAVYKRIMSDSDHGYDTRQYWNLMPVGLDGRRMNRPIRLTNLIRFCKLKDVGFAPRTT
ncbi:MAG: hypothetical protein HYY46_24565 [Deltaproteobacteria bacterium]|nr:hypothetical protein [Deltaproteobacteria bacterium]